ncbi:MAG: hypothetical protein HQ567_33875 [Candidatus Nealsonbacteria bacterium]|nr:hypothetical protein [Candidatus Nealsonbacteria bacterium]
MQRRPIVVATFCLIGALAAGEAMAQRSGRSGGFGRGGIPSAGSFRPPGTLAGPNIPSPTIRRPESGTTVRPPVSIPNPVSGTLQGHLGVRPPAAIGAAGWINAPHQPFTPAWYTQHPKAWQFAHPHADAAVAATAVGVTRWLAVSGSSTTVYESGIVTEQGTGEVGTGEVSVEAEAAYPAQGAADDDGQWMPIGTFALRPAGQTATTRVVQLSVHHNGTVRGSHFDVIGNGVQTVQGTVNKQNLQVSWTAGTGKVVFRAPLGELTKPQGNVTAQFPGETTARWQTVQVTQ